VERVPLGGGYLADDQDDRGGGESAAIASGRFRPNICVRRRPAFAAGPRIPANGSSLTERGRPGSHI
jgi:hypothetical protein